VQLVQAIERKPGRICEGRVYVTHASLNKQSDVPLSTAREDHATAAVVLRICFIQVWRITWKPLLSRTTNKLTLVAADVKTERHTLATSVLRVSEKLEEVPYLCHFTTQIL
jgi:hypothetical protein